MMLSHPVLSFVEAAINAVAVKPAVAIVAPSSKRQAPVITANWRIFFSCPILQIQVSGESFTIQIMGSTFVATWFRDAFSGR
jgi:hypothetical protein